MAIFHPGVDRFDDVCRVTALVDVNSTFFFYTGKDHQQMVVRAHGSMRRNTSKRHESQGVLMSSLMLELCSPPSSFFIGCGYCTFNATKLLE